MHYKVTQQVKLIADSARESVTVRLQGSFGNRKLTQQTKLILWKECGLLSEEIKCRGIPQECSYPGIFAFIAEVEKVRAYLCSMFTVPECC